MCHVTPFKYASRMFRWWANNLFIWRITPGAKRESEGRNLSHGWETGLGLLDNDLRLFSKVFFNCWLLFKTFTPIVRIDVLSAITISQCLWWYIYKWTDFSRSPPFTLIEMCYKLCNSIKLLVLSEGFETEIWYFFLQESALKHLHTLLRWSNKQYTRDQHLPYIYTTYFKF